MFGASNYHWLNYTDDKIVHAFNTAQAAYRGTRLHNLAKELIELGVRLPTDPQTTMGQFVNDAIGFHMRAEQMLFYSSNIYGTADAISFRKKELRIHDLKTGVTKSSFHQLEIYAALFCLEYGHKPHDIETELRIYQLDQVLMYQPDPHDIVVVMDKIVTTDELIEALKQDAPM